MTVQAIPFFDPMLSQLQRQLAYDTSTQTADLRLKGQRLTEDLNLMRPYMERRFGQQAHQVAGNVAGRGFHGANSGIMNKAMTNLSEDQTFARGQFERQYTRDQEDIERTIAQLTQRNVLTGAEGVRQGAGRASQRAYPTFMR